MTRTPDIEIANTIFYCSRWHECVAFYKSGLGLRESFRNAWFVEFELTETARLSIADASRSTMGNTGGRGVTLTLRVADIRTARDVLLARGLAPGKLRSHPWNAQLFHVFDPEGNRVEFWAPNE